MVTIRWFWIDGSFDEFTVSTLKEAENMRLHLYMNEDIVSVEIFDESGKELF